MSQLLAYGVAACRLGGSVVLATTRGLFARSRRMARVIVALSVPFVADASASAQARGAAIVEVEGLSNGRQRVTSGEFSAAEWRWTGSPDDAIFARSDVYCAFDRANDRFRFDRKQKMRLTEFNPVNSDGQVKHVPGASRIVESNVKYARLADKSLQWISSDPSQVDVRRPDNVFLAVNAFHVDSVGVATTGDLGRFPNLDKLLDAFARQQMQPAGKSGTLDELVWTFSGGKLERRLWLDPAKDYAPVRMRVSATSKGGWRPIVEIATEWERRNDVWVPIRSTHLEGENGDLKKRYEIEISWSRVNEELPETLFSTKGFGLSGFVKVVDSRLGVPVVLEKLNLPPSGAPSEKIAQEAKPRTRTLLVLGNLAIAAILVLWYIRRRRKRP